MGYEKTQLPLRPRTRKRLVVSQSRRERACKRTGDANATFCGKETQRNERTGGFAKSRRKRYAACGDDVFTVLAGGDTPTQLAKVGSDSEPL